ATADIAVQATGVRAEGNRLVIAVDVLGDGVAEQAAQHRAAHDGAAIAVTDGRAEQPTGNRAEDRAGRGIAAAAAAFITALLVIDRALVAAIVVEALVA